MDAEAALRLRHTSYAAVLAGLTALFASITYLSTALYFMVLYSAFLVAAAFVLSLAEDKAKKALSALPPDSPLHEEKRPRGELLALGAFATLLATTCFARWRASMVGLSSYPVVVLDYAFYVFIFLIITCLWGA